MRYITVSHANTFVHIDANSLKMDGKQSRKLSPHQL